MASSYKVDIGGLLSGGRQHLLVDQQVALEPFEGIRFTGPAHVRLNVHASGDLLEVEGSVDVKIHGECDRCLGEVERPMHVEVVEQLETGAEAQKDPFGPSNVLAGDRLDVKDLTTQVVISAIPLGLLCSEDCLGICAICGENKNTGECTCQPQAGD